MTTYTATMLPVSKTYDRTEMQSVVNDLFTKITQLAAEITLLQAQVKQLTPP